jgi:hypothetical protein
MHHRHKLDKAYCEDAFGVPDVPTKIGHKHLAKITDQWTDHSRREDRRSWKCRRKTRWRPK